MHIKEIAVRYQLLMETYLAACGTEYRDELMQQVSLINNFISISERVKQEPVHRRLFILRRELEKILLPPSFRLPLNPNLEVCGIQIEECRWMDSNSIPLWLVFKNNDPFGKPIIVIFKYGDDLRQDILTLQMIKIMDKLWKQEGLDLHTTIYNCIATGENMGLIEVVPDSKTVAEIQKADGGITSAFKKTTLTNWLHQLNPNPTEYIQAVENFTLSCAAYSVATYVLGIGDRHNDNVMLDKYGHLFHIDFGHFLGNIMKFGGIKRESAPFVLTPEMAFVMGGEKSENFQRFIDLCCKAYNILRKNANIFLNLFAMMLSTGIPQLKRFEDIYYLRNVFFLSKTDEEAKKHFTSLIYESLYTKRTRVNNAIHILAHPD
jgi:phosphatidylinositol kinase/protein kinase (PI-3  family)